MDVIAIIPARGGSKGIPNKNIIEFAGKPLIAWTIGQAQSSNLVSDIYVTSDSQEILSIANRYGAKTITRPTEISSDESSSETALLHALDSIVKEPELVIFLQATSPLRKLNDIDLAVNKLIDDHADSLLSLTITQEFMWEKSEGSYKPLTYNLDNRCGHKYLKYLYYENGSIYVFKPQILRKHNNRLGGKQSIYLMEPWQRVDIDDYETYDYCLWQFKRHYSIMYGKDFINENEN